MKRTYVDTLARELATARGQIEANVTLLNKFRDDAAKFRVAVTWVQRDPDFARRQHREQGEQMVHRIVGTHAHSAARVRIDARKPIGGGLLEA